MIFLHHHEIINPVEDSNNNIIMWDWNASLEPNISPAVWQFDIHSPSGEIQTEMTGEN
jgi:hypothetical protein